MKRKLLLLAWILAFALSSVDCQLNGVGEWQILSKHNFSSQIRLHPHILLVVTVPWCGESRSLMKEISGLVADWEDEFSSLKLMVVYGNLEKILADTIGATEGITVLYYHHSVSYKYQGRLRARNILYSIQPYMIDSLEELPLKSLNSHEDLDTFLSSSDKSLILFEFCGWSSKLLARGRNNGTERKDISLHGNPFGTRFGMERDGVQISGGHDNEKDIKSGELKCKIDNGFSGIPLLGQFSSINDRDPFQETENIMSGVGLSCNFTEFEQFNSFFLRFVTLAREFFLPPEKQRFGLVTERSLLKYFGIQDSDSWLVMLYLAGCPGCSKIVKEINELQSVLRMNNKVIAELDGHGQDLDTILPADKPSVILFVDRSSESLETRRQGNEALDSFVELAQKYQIPKPMSGRNNHQPERPSVQASHALRRPPGHPKLKLSSTTENIKLKEKMSLIVVNEGKHVSLNDVATDLQGSSLHEILAYLLKSKKEGKLSSLANQVGFQLLSDDLDIKLTDKLPSQTGFQSNLVSPTPSQGLDTGIVDPDNHPRVQEENYQSTGDVASHHEDKVAVSVDTEAQLISEEPDIHTPDHYTTSTDVHVGKTSSSQVYESPEPQLHFEESVVSFFFSDGNYRLQRALTGGSAIPSLAIVDPVSEQHYVFPEESILNRSSLVSFLHAFLNGTLVPYQLSESKLQSTKEATRPPFVNRDFHEMDSIPRVTTQTFSELVLGFQYDYENASNAWHKDVLVLFSNDWCGFCQRMELVVREVYRAVKGYMEVLYNGYRNEQTDLSGDNLKNVIYKFPLIYLMDCTLNDCTSILKSTNQREVYPTVMLFPAEKRYAVPYSGDIAVADIIKFMADHGNNSHHLISENGIVWTSPAKGGKPESLFKGSSSTTFISKENSYQVMTSEIANNENHIKFHTSTVVVGSVLTATTKISAYPFENSKILIVKADPGIGFQGLILNKHIKWDSLDKLEEGLEFLTDAPLSFGGPVVKQGMPLVGLTRRKVTESQYPEIKPGLYLLDQVATANEIEELRSGNRFIADYWFFLGYSSWGWDQLFDEIAQGAWSTSAGHEDAIHFDWPLT